MPPAAADRTRSRDLPLCSLRTVSCAARKEWAMSGSRSRIVPEVDFEQNGRQHGFLRLFHSVHSSAYGFIPIPVVVLRNGDGPTALLVSGTHGDEYEGQV